MASVITLRRLMHDRATLSAGGWRSLDEEVIDRLSAIAEEGAIEPGERDWLRQAIATTVEHVLPSLAESRAPDPRVPAALMAQVRRAARERIGLDTVIRGYMAAHAVASDRVLRAAGPSKGDVAHLRRVLSSLS